MFPSKKNINIWRVGFFLALRQIKRANFWTTSLIVIVMALTFLNLVVVNGVLVGLLQGAVEAQRTRGTGDIAITKLLQKTEIERSGEIMSVLKGLSQVKNVSVKYNGSGFINADYRKKLRQDEAPNKVGVAIAGIDPINEDKINNLSKYVIDGTYLNENDTDGVMIGATLLYQYTPIEVEGFSTLKNIKIGDRLKLTVGNNSKEVVFRGVIRTKVDSNDFRVFMLESEARKLIGRNNLNADEIAVQLNNGIDLAQAAYVKQILSNNNFDEGARIQTWLEAQPKFLKDMMSTFGLLGNLIGSIGLAVASITIFIVIFVNAITRKKFIGILKGIGIHSKSIEISYIIQSIFYAVAGAVVGFIFLYGFLVPFVDAHPINFPFSDGIIYAPVLGSFIRALILLITTVIAGYVPAKIIVKKNTLDSILGR